MKNILLSLLFTSIFFANTTTVFAQAPAIKASVNTENRLEPFVVITNTSNHHCGIIQSGVGTIAVTKVVQEGKEISPLPLNVAFDEELDMQLAKHLQTLQPGNSIKIPLQILPYKDGLALQAITWSKEAGAYGMIYPLSSNKSYTMEATYNSPLTGTHSLPACSATTIEAGPDADTTFETTFGVILGIMLLLLIIFILLRLSRKHKRITKTVILIGAFIFSSSGITHVAQADYSVPESAVGQFDECMATLERYPEITDQVLDTLDSARVVLYTNHGGVNYATDWPDGSYHIHWDAFNTYNYYSDDGSTIVSTPCDRLFHEMYHVFEMMKGINDRHYCNDSGLEINEVEATRAQNRLREAMGLLPRTHYGTERLPAGECNPPPVVPPACTESCGESTGEPHLKTFDNLRYDFQAVGEFVAARDPQGDFEIQTRQAPWSTARDVSMNTAVAMKVGTHKVEVQIYEHAMSILINGERQASKNIRLAGGITIISTQTTGWNSINSVRITWPDTSVVVINRIGNFGLDLVVDPAKSRRGTLEGLLGNYNGDSKDDVKIRGKNTTITPDFDKLYPTYADSWRVDDKTSLFTYKPGENTKTHTDKTFPDKPITANDLPNRAVAETICKNLGVTDPAILKNCILDVARTGRAEFARAASVLQQKTKAAGQTWILSATKPGEVARVLFEGKANENIFLDITNATFPYQCGGMGIKDTTGQQIATGCIAYGKGYIDTTQLPVTGTYSIFIDPTDKNIGQATVQLIKVTNFKSTITPGGQPVRAKLSQPGSIAELTFAGTAGQKVMIEFLGGTIPDQCGGIALLTPEGTPRGSVCLSKGTGVLDEKGTFLPVTGIYTIKIDPPENKTGEITVQVR